MDNNYLLYKTLSGEKKDEQKRGAKTVESSCAAILTYADEQGYFKKGKDWKDLLPKIKEAMDLHYAKYDAAAKAAKAAEEAKKPPRGKAAELEALQAQMKAMQARIAEMETTGGK